MEQDRRTMNDQPALSIRELTAIMRECNSPLELKSLLSNLRTEFDNYPLSDQGFLLAMIGITIMNITADSPDSRFEEMYAPLLLRGLNWTLPKEKQN